MSAIDAATAVEGINDDSSAGRRLRAAREQSGLSVRDVASALNLMVSHVRGIEADRYAQLINDRQFLRHLHDYAVLVELDESEIVDLYRSQSAEVAAQLEAQPGKHRKRYNSKWFSVGALAVACVVLGMWALKQTLPLPSVGDFAKPNNGALIEMPAVAPPKDKNRLARNATIDTPKPTDSSANTASTAAASDEDTTAPQEKSTRGASKTIARDDQTADETGQEPSGKKTVNAAATNDIAGKNALLAIGAKPLKKTLVTLKNEI